MQTKMKDVVLVTPLRQDLGQSAACISKADPQGVISIYYKVLSRPDDTFKNLCKG